ncbi:MAG TPA: arginine--tRNA ligase [Micromonosporaceae bacterium]|nr:arginine--tRNA ligase [Micromonosporaceae bacterium]
MTPANLAETVLIAANAVLAERDLDTSVLPESTTVERPRNPEHGDYASTIALTVAKRVGLAPREFAQALADRLVSSPGITAVEVAGPGFLNIRLDASATGEVARVVVSQGDAYGTNDSLAGQTLNLEFVSANPVGPLHIGHVRWAAVGDALARLLRASGAAVGTEYYFNDAGTQIDRFAESLLAVAKGEPTPEDGYHGEYVGEIAAQVVTKTPDVLSKPVDEALATFRVEGIALMFDEIKASLASFGVHFDVYFNESALHERGELASALQRLTTEGHTYESDDAIWLRTTDFGDDRDRPLIRRTGTPTYFMADCAYYLDRRERGFDRIVIMLGADHHGYIGRMRAVAACFGDKPDETIEILIGQFVNLFKGGLPVRMSKRAGAVVTLEDMVDAIGADAARYALARYSVDSPIDLDLDLWARRSNDNPVYYVQYAHARIASLLRNAAEIGATKGDDFDPSLLSHDREADLLKALAEYPTVVATAAELREPHRVARYLEDLAGAWHRFYDAARVLPQGDEPITDLTHARLWLVEAARIVFANGLRLLGVSAPDRM